MSDWYGTYSADASIKAGLDLEMPVSIDLLFLHVYEANNARIQGPPTWRADALQRCVVAQKIRVAEIDARVRKVC